jgi:hypothetical protein
MIIDNNKHNPLKLLGQSSATRSFVSSRSIKVSGSNLTIENADF